MASRARHTHTARVVAAVLLAVLAFAPAAPVLAASVGGCASTACAAMRADMPSPCHHGDFTTCAHAALCVTTAPAFLPEPAGIASAAVAHAQPGRASARRTGLAGLAPPTPPPNR